MLKKNRLILVGISGTGKDSLANKLIEKFKNEGVNLTYKESFSSYILNRLGYKALYEIRHSEYVQSILIDNAIRDEVIRGYLDENSLATGFREENSFLTAYKSYSPIFIWLSRDDYIGHYDGIGGKFFKEIRNYYRFHHIISLLSTKNTKEEIEDELDRCSTSIVKEVLSKYDFNPDYSLNPIF